MDHDVRLPSGTTVTNSVRVLAHLEGSEIVFTICQIDLTDDEFDCGVVMVEVDLDRVKRLMEERVCFPPLCRSLAPSRSCPVLRVRGASPRMPTARGNVALGACDLPC